MAKSGKKPRSSKDKNPYPPRVSSLASHQCHSQPHPDLPTAKPLTPPTAGPSSNFGYFARAPTPETDILGGESGSGSGTLPAIIETHEGPSAAHLSYTESISPFELSRATSPTKSEPPTTNQPLCQTTAPEEPRRRLPQPGQALPGTMASATTSRPIRDTQPSPLRNNSPLDSRSAMDEAVIKSYNQLWPYIVSPRRHTAIITTTTSSGDAQRAYLYRNRYPTTLTLVLAFFGLLPFAIFFTIAFGCYNLDNYPELNPLMKDYCHIKNLLTAAFPLSFCVGECSYLIWAFQERVVIYWLSLEQDPGDDEPQWKYTPAKEGTFLLDWGSYNGYKIAELHEKGIKRAQKTGTTRSTKRRFTRGTAGPSAVPVTHWSDPKLTIGSDKPNLFLQPLGITRRSTDKTNAPRRNKSVLREAIKFQEEIDREEAIDLQDMQAKPIDDGLHPDAPGLTQKEKLRRWKEVRVKELREALQMQTNPPYSQDDGETPESSRGGLGGWISNLTGNGGGGDQKGKQPDKGKGRMPKEMDISAPII